MKIVQFQVLPGEKNDSLVILMEDGRMFQLGATGWLSLPLPEHPMGLPKNPLGPPPEDKL
jgi:hypothetical protein